MTGGVLRSYSTGPTFYATGTFGPAAQILLPIARLVALQFF